MKRLIGSIVVMALGFLGPAAVAHADGQDAEEEAWARLNEQINADFEAGRLTPDKGETSSHTKTASSPPPAAEAATREPAPQRGTSATTRNAVA